MHKEAHGVGTTPEFPSEQEIDEAMEGHDDHYYVPTFGDGSLTTTKTGDLPRESEMHREDVDIVGPTVGQTGSSTTCIGIFPAQGPVGPM